MSRYCACPADGSFYCYVCLNLAARAGLALPTQAQPRAGIQAPRSRVKASRAQEVSEAVLAVDRPPTAILEAQQSPYRSKLEGRYAQVLDAWQHEGRLDQWWYEPIRLALAPRTTYTPDFMLVRDASIELHETKGFQRDDAMAKLKIAAHLYPIFRFYLVTWQHQSWHWKEIPSA